MATAVKTIPVPLEKVWDVLADHEGMETWGRGVKIVLATEGSPSRNGVGAVRRLILPGPAPTIVERVTRFDEPNVLGYEALSGVPWKNHRGEVTLSSVAGGTRIEWKITGDGPLAAVAVKPLALGLTALLARAASRA